MQYRTCLPMSDKRVYDSTKHCFCLLREKNAALGVKSLPLLCGSAYDIPSYLGVGVRLHSKMLYTERTDFILFFSLWCCVRQHTPQSYRLRFNDARGYAVAVSSHSSWQELWNEYVVVVAVRVHLVQICATAVASSMSAITMHNYNIWPR